MHDDAFTQPIQRSEMYVFCRQRLYSASRPIIASPVRVLVTSKSVYITQICLTFTKVTRAHGFEYRCMLLPFVNGPLLRSRCGQTSVTQQASLGRGLPAGVACSCIDAFIFRVVCILPTATVQRAPSKWERVSPADNSSFITIPKHL